MSYNWDIVHATISETASSTSRNFTVPSGEVWEPQSVQFTYTASSVSKTRIPCLRVMNDTVTVFDYVVQTTNTASQAATYIFMLGVGETTAARNTSVWHVTLPVFQLSPGWVLSLTAIDSTTGDNITGVDISYVVRRS